jgi:hypothetical protein
MNGLKYGISDNKLLAAVVCGFIATQIATITGFWYEIIHLPAVDWNRFNGAYLVGAGEGVSDFEVFIMGWSFHLMTGIILTIAFAFLIRPKLTFFPYTMMGNFQAAVAWGVVLALLSMFIITPYLDPYNAHPGFMSLDLKLADNEGDIRPGWQTPLVILIWHLVYGIQLGAFYNPSPEAEAVAERATAPATGGPMPAAASAGGGGGGGGGGGS